MKGRAHIGYLATALVVFLASPAVAVDKQELSEKIKDKPPVPQYTGKRGVDNPHTLTGRVLLVDDYLERDEAGNPLFYQERQRFYKRWGVYNFDYDVWSIADSGWIDYETFNAYDAVVFASDGEVGESDFTWWYEIGAPGYSSLHQYMEGGGKLLAIGPMILLDVTQEYPPDPQPGDFEYDWFGVGSGPWAWDYWYDFSWAIGAEPGYPDSMQLDPDRLPEQEDFAVNIFSLRPDVDTLFLKGMGVDGSPPMDYMEPVAIIYRPDGEAVSALVNFSLYFRPEDSVYITMTNILRDEFDCTYYDDPAPLPPWHAGVQSILGTGLYLFWDPLDEDDIAAINIYKSVDGGEYSLYETLGPEAVEYTDTDVVDGSLYGYKLSCVDAIGQESELSREVSEYAGRPPAPEDFSANSGDEQVLLTWIHPGGEGIESFRIYRKDGFYGDYNEMAEVPQNETEYTDTEVANGNAYYYYATSISNSGIESYPSDSVFAYPYNPESREGILIVNGVHWPTYGSNIILMYEERALTGYFDYQFWDLFTDPPSEGRPHPETVIGEGAPPEVLFDAFRTIIWVGNKYAGDFEHWENNQQNIIDFLDRDGGNIILPVRYGQDWFFEELAEYCGIVPDSWVSSGSDNLTAKHDSLTDITAGSGQSLWDIPLTDRPENVWIYEAHNEAPGMHAGFITLPNGIGGGGAFCYIAGRSYRWNYDDLRANFEVIHRYFLGMTQTGIEDEEVILPDDYILYQNYPNPFNLATTIKFGLPSKSHVRLEIFDILGRLVAILADGPMDAGYHEIVWDGRNGSGSELSSGVYLYMLKAGEFNSMKKMLILK